MKQPTTLISHIFNEEYLLPFWLRHHKDMFDQIIIIDYHSTDKSLEICKEICPTCKIMVTKNPCFEAVKVDEECMEIEKTIEGIKMVLNTTEFLVCETSVCDLFSNTTPVAYTITSITPYSFINHNIHHLHDLYDGLLSNHVVYHFDRGDRKIHNYDHGDYTIGRHGSKHPSTPINKAHLIWLGFYPMGLELLTRKLQIQQNIPQSDKNVGNGKQHLYSKEKILSILVEKVKSGKPLKQLNEPLYHLLKGKSSP